MPSLNTIRTSNSLLRSTLKSPTALFVGGTSGIGQSTLRQLARHTESPTAYIIGRSETRAKPFLSELRGINAQGKFHFIEADVSLVRNVDVACREILGKEKKLNFLFMTPGGISLGGRNETIEGPDTLFALRYYTRMRFIQNLLPLLESTPHSERTRVISIYGGGFEFPINTSDLDLKHTFSLLNAYKHSITMTTLSMEHLSKLHPKVSFIHAYPGLVGTNIYSNSFPAPVAAFYNYAMWPLMWPFSVGLEECGERHLFHLSSGNYPAKGADHTGTDAEEVARGVDGEVGSGAYLLNWKGDVRSSAKILEQYRQDGTAELVWKHTEQILEQAVRR
ncbi:hypothetical protein BJX66DRAFT_335287 [Aspergillus keveii]|uniref:NAD(P)-binding protein n=1 Tax=Aspergillus keveii TaxID=714993 RepID=A0ABR4GEZ4_9EURO